MLVQIFLLTVHFRALGHKGHYRTFTVLNWSHKCDIEDTLHYAPHGLLSLPSRLMEIFFLLFSPILPVVRLLMKKKTIMKLSVVFHCPPLAEDGNTMLMVFTVQPNSKSVRECPLVELFKKCQIYKNPPSLKKKKKAFISYDVYLKKNFWKQK